MDGWMDRWVDSQTDGCVDSQTDGWVDSQTDGWIDRQISMHLAMTDNKLSKTSLICTRSGIPEAFICGRKSEYLDQIHLLNYLTF